MDMLQSGAWLRHAAHANEMAQLLHDGLKELADVKILFPRQANSVFAELPTHVINGLRERGWMFYTFIGKGGCRFMCSWDNTPDDVKEFVGDMKALLADKSRAADDIDPRFYGRK